MSASGQKQTSERVRARSAHPPTTDIAARRLDVRFVPSVARALDIRAWLQPFLFTQPTTHQPPSEASIPLGYRKACLAHEPRYSCNGPSLTFAIIAAPNSTTRNVNTTRFRQFHDMLPSFLRGALAAINGTPAIPLETVKRWSLALAAMLFRLWRCRRRPGVGIDIARCHWRLTFGRFASNFAAGPGKIVGATGRRRERLAVDQRALG